MTDLKADTTFDYAASSVGSDDEIVSRSERKHKKAHKDEQYASSIEKFIGTVFAPELLTFQGRTAVLTIWTLLVMAAIYGATQAEINFTKEYFIPPDTDVERFFLFDKEYFQSGFYAYIL